MLYKTKNISVLALLCAMVQGAWAQASWDAVYTMTQTTAADWTAIEIGSSTGKTLGTDGTGFDATTGTLTLNFESATSIEAGKPYIVKWMTGDNIVNPAFSGVTISNIVADITSIDGKVTFTGNYDYQSFATENRSILFLGDGNTLYYPQSGASIGACRVYFQLRDGITMGDSANSVRAFKLKFGEDTTGVTTPLALWRGAGGEALYTLDGRRLDSQPSRAGVYIYKGIKKVVK